MMFHRQTHGAFVCLYKGGSRQSKSYGLRFGWISPQATSRCQLAVSHYGLCRVVTDSGTELPLSPYCNPLPAQLRQSRRFPRQLPTFLASFADMVSQVNTDYAMAVTTTCRHPIHHAHSRQATLHTASLDRKGTLHRIAGSSPAP